MQKRPALVPEESSEEEDYSDAEAYSEDDEGGSDEDTRPLGPRVKYGVDRPAIYNVEAMHDKLEDIAWIDSVDWLEHQVHTPDAPTEVANVEDDTERELAFYNQALASTTETIRRLVAAGVPWRRPRDYYAEMVKSDEHMGKVKAQLVAEQKAIQGMEERKKARVAKKFAKEVQAERQKERAQQRKKVTRRN